MFKILIVFSTILISLSSINSYSQGDYVSPTALNLHFDETKVLQHLQTLSSDLYEGRETGTKGAEKARKYIINQFYSLEVKPLKKQYEQSFSITRNNKTIKANNVLAYVKGTHHSKKYIIISAHYDHEGIKKGKIYNGADDNASGVGALFAFAEYFKNNPPKHSVILAALDAEEKGLLGAKYLVNNPVIEKKNIVLNINMDMISRSDNDELYVVGTRYTPVLKKVISEFDDTNQVNLKIGHEGLDKKQNWTHSSDHAPFYKQGIPFLYFGVEDHKDYHMPTDDFENIHPEFYVKAVNTIINVFREVDSLNLKR